VSGNVWVIRASEHGMSAAAPAPWTVRAAMSAVSEVAPAQAALPRPKTVRPSRKPVRASTRSASAPAESSSAANASVYPLTIHCAVDSAPPRSLPIGPSATFTIVASSVIMRKPRQIAVRPSASLRRVAAEVVSMHMNRWCGSAGLFSTTFDVTLIDVA
jgi:hypothetical protein